MPLNPKDDPIIVAPAPVSAGDKLTAAAVAADAGAYKVSVTADIVVGPPDPALLYHVGIEAAPRGTLDFSPLISSVFEGQSELEAVASHRRVSGALAAAASQLEKSGGSPKEVAILRAQANGQPRDFLPHTVTWGGMLSVDSDIQPFLRVLNGTVVAGLTFDKAKQDTTTTADVPVDTPALGVLV